MSIEAWFRDMTQHNVFPIGGAHDQQLMVEISYAIFLRFWSKNPLL